MIFLQKNFINIWFHENYKYKQNIMFVFLLTMESFSIFLNTLIYLDNIK